MDAKALALLFRSPVTDEMLQFLTRATLRVAPCGRDAQCASPPMSGGARRTLPSIHMFITRLVRYTNVYTATLLTTAVYLERLRLLLPRDATGIPSTAHRIFLACLILSAKFHNDSSPLNKHWTKYTDGLFTTQDVNLMERQLLRLFDWNVRVGHRDLCRDLAPLLAPIKLDLTRCARMHARSPLPRRALCSPAHSLSASSSTSTLVSTGRSSALHKPRPAAALQAPAPLYSIPGHIL
ncbi:AEL195Wp [Eremothecium gossypii ATCC 10895]|uniref:AEL195Wp n=1 Tax=Eremothecium gossypii (strain ATCC 10895 / CBS 109.51 / FGSC 9923 / NRRL Y-1056) TaxID=284811 RepID=Q758F7_EREGS|nr:AEL195Wp [Eremothecium gossypii ATCC 10895]AAS52490.1 AEL195Wp [Eremothecium gossypii ATCC 10895]AEY96789.1 FAEL195Wp [Eremothecium gossypii FDAG1]